MGAFSLIVVINLLNSLVMSLLAVVTLSLFVVHCSANLEAKFDAHQVHHDEEHSHLHLDPAEYHDDTFDYNDDEFNEVTWDDLTDKEKEAASANFIDNMDRDHDGYVTKDEIKMAIIAVMETENRDMASEDMKEFDEDKNGNISLNEYFGSIESSEDGEYGHKFDKLRFELADLDSSKDLSFEELVAFLYPYDYPRMREYLIKEVLYDHDTDHNGELSKEEFFRISTENEDFQEDEDTFDLMDVDRNGQLNQDEIYELLSKSTDRLAESELEWLVSRLSNPKILDKWSRGEIADNIHHFVDSNFEDSLLKHHDEL